MTSVELAGCGGFTERPKNTVESGADSAVAHRTHEDYRASHETEDMTAPTVVG